ncbi:MAG: S8 family peptidase, partial [Anaerolineales bacterium]|nr:S8 family peptidase [Anaerolineales bacterium]
MKHIRNTVFMSAITLLVLLIGSARFDNNKKVVMSASFIVQAESMEVAATAVSRVGGHITHELGVINAVGATLSPAQQMQLPDTVRLYQNDAVEVSGIKGLDTFYPTLIGAARLHDQNITGMDVTVAVIDTGYWQQRNLNNNTDKDGRVLAQYDAIADSFDQWGAYAESDDHGHGAHISSIILSSGQAPDGAYNGVAPDANLVVVKAFDENGAGSYLDVIRAIDWIITNKEKYDIRVVNLSFSSEPQSFYWDDPMNQAVMRAWEAGIVVVAAAGNRGPDAMTIGVPGNVPYIITVGAMSDNYTPADGSDDILASFSAAGPTVEGFVKPEIVAPGGHMLGMMGGDSKLVIEHPEFFELGNFFTMSGTSQSTAVTSGIVALMLQHDPTLTPDEVKCRLMSSARPAVNDDGSLAYSIFQQGAGMVNAYNAVYSTATDCVNQTLDLTADLDGTAHFWGRANRDEAGNYYIMDLDGYMWADGY